VPGVVVVAPSRAHSDVVSGGGELRESGALPAMELTWWVAGSSWRGAVCRSYVEVVMAIGVHERVHAPD